VSRYNYLLKAADYRRNQAKKLQQAIDDLQQKEVDLQENKDQKIICCNSKPRKNQNWKRERRERRSCGATSGKRKQTDKTNCRKRIKPLNN